MQSCPHKPRSCHQDDNNEGYTTRNVLVPCCSSVQWLWSTEPAVTGLECFPWPLAWDPPRGWARYYPKHRANVPGCRTAKSGGDIPPPSDLSDGCPAASVGLKLAREWQDTGKIPPRKRRLEVWQARVCWASSSSRDRQPGQHGTCSDPPPAPLPGMELKLSHESTSGAGGGKPQAWKP